MVGFFALFFLAASVLSASVAFKDVPAHHWSRSALDKLLTAGIVSSDQSAFVGNKAVTRYELAQYFVRALAHLEQQRDSVAYFANAEELAQIRRLAEEFSDELALIGVRQTSLADDLSEMQLELSQLRQYTDSIREQMKDSSEKVRLSGDWLVRHTSKTHRYDYAVHPLTGRPGAGASNNVYTESQIRFRAQAKIDENITFNARIRFFNRAQDRFNAAQTNRGGTFGLNGIGQNSVADMLVDSAFLEIKKVFDNRDWFILGKSSWVSGHSIFINNDFDAVRYNFKDGNKIWVAQYIYDRHQGSYKDTAAVDFRGVWNLSFKSSSDRFNWYASVFAQDEPDLANRRLANTFIKGTLPGEQRSDSRRDAEFGATYKTGRDKSVTLDLGLAVSDYSVEINKPAVGNIVDVNMRGLAGSFAANWRANDRFSFKLAYDFGDDKFAGAYTLHLDRRWSMGTETPYEDIARGNQWFRRGLINMSALKLQTEYHPKNSRHYFRAAANFLDEMKDHVSNDLTHHLAGNIDGIIPAAFVRTNSDYDSFNNIGIPDPKMMILNLEYCYQLAKNTRLRLGYVNCIFDGSARKAVGAVQPVKSGRGRFDDFDYQMFWSEIYSRF